VAIFDPTDDDQKAYHLWQHYANQQAQLPSHAHTATTAVTPSTWAQTTFSWPSQTTNGASFSFGSGILQQTKSWTTGTIPEPPKPDPRARPRARVWLGEDEAIPEGPWTVLGEGRDPLVWSRFVVIEAPGLERIPPGGMLPVYVSFEAVLDKVRAAVVGTLAW
jgi:hypothetical protein